MQYSTSVFELTQSSRSVVLVFLLYSVYFETVSLSCGQRTHWNAGSACVKSLMSFGESNDCVLLSNASKWFSETDTCYN